MGDVTITEDLTVPSGTTLTVKETATLNIPEGVSLINEGEIVNLGVIVNNGTIQNEGTITNSGRINSDTEIEWVTGNAVVPASYSFLAGARLTYTKGEDTYAIFRIDVDYSLFATGGKVYVNDTLLTNSDYSSESGSTIIKITEQFMNTLDAGDYVLKVVFNNGAVSKTSFTVVNKTVEEVSTSNPQTGDNILFYVLLLGLSTTCLAGVFVKKKILN